MSDILIVVGVLIVAYYVPVAIAGLIDRVRSSWAIVASCVGIALLVAAVLTAPDGVTLRDVPGAFVRVLAMITT